MRICLSLEYDGTGYCGWQTQPDGRTVQDEVQAALAKVADEPVSLVCAGRTDAGVHATSQIVHFDTTATRTLRAWLLGTNTELPKDISVRWVTEVNDEFHARFSAVERRYRYVILNRNYRSALLNHRVHLEPRTLDHDAMQIACQHILGTHDFSAFRAAGCQAHSPVRTVSNISVRRVDDFVVIDIAANAFLQNMVRIIAGVLTRVGRHEAQTQWVAEILQSKDRKHPGVTAPPCGLYMTAVAYPLHFDLPRRTEPAHGVLPFV